MRQVLVSIARTMMHQCIYRIRTDSGFVLYAFALPIVISIKQPAETRFSRMLFLRYVESLMPR